MPLETRQASLWDTLRLQLLVGLPAFLAGVVVPVRWFLAWRCRHDAGRATMRLLAALRAKYGCDHLWTWFPPRRTLLVLDPQSIEAVLASPDNAGDAPLKKRALSRFAPESVIVSSGCEWTQRRPFNEAVLDLGRLHRHHEAFRQVVAREAGQVVAGELRFAQFQSLGQRISQQVILGMLRPDMNESLACLLARSNLLLRDGKSFAALYRELAGALAQPEPACLVADAAARSAATTPVPAQIAFWMFVLKDAVELHVPRTLALIAAHPATQARARDEVRAHAVLTSEAIAGLSYLDACLREQLRLWTPVPLLLRRATADFDLRDGVHVERERQILVHAGFYHRDPQVFGAHADVFAPDAALGAFPATYFFSAHRQGCAGRSLVTFVLMATLAALLARFRFELVGPTIDTARIPYLYDHFALSLRAHPD